MLDRCAKRIIYAFCLISSKCAVLLFSFLPKKFIHNETPLFFFFFFCFLRVSWRWC